MGVTSPDHILLEIWNGKRGHDMPDSRDCIIRCESITEASRAWERQLAADVSERLPQLDKRLKARRAALAGIRE